MDGIDEDALLGLDDDEDDDDDTEKSWKRLSCGSKSRMPGRPKLTDVCTAID